MAGGSILVPIVSSLQRICGMDMDWLSQPTPPSILLSQIGTCPTIFSWEHIATRLAWHGHLCMRQHTIRLASELGKGYVSLISVEDYLTTVSKSDSASDPCVV
jgi:hypothetical protein